MKNNKKEGIIYIVATVVTIIFIIIASLINGSNKQADNFDVDAYLKEYIESSKIRVNDNIYHGVYGAEEIKELPEGFELLGEVVESTTEELTSHLQSNAIAAGAQVYANANDNSKIYVKISAEDYVSYMQFVLDIAE